MIFPVSLFAILASKAFLFAHPEHAILHLLLSFHGHATTHDDSTLASWLNGIEPSTILTSSIR